MLIITLISHLHHSERANPLNSLVYQCRLVSCMVVDTTEVVACYNKIIIVLPLWISAPAWNRTNTGRNASVAIFMG